MKKICIAALLVCALFSTGCGALQPGDGAAAVDGNSTGRAFKNRTSDVQVEGEGVVTRILADDRSGAQHQRFIVRLASGQTILITHNIDVAPRVDTLSEGDSLGFKGEYVWNEQGGLVHFTHHDPQGRHEAGWLKHNGRTYQ